MMWFAVVCSALLGLASGFPGQKAMSQDITGVTTGRLLEVSSTEIAYNGLFSIKQDSTAKVLRIDVGNYSMTAPNWRYTGIYTKDGYYEMANLRRGRGLCQKYLNWTYDDLAKSYSTGASLLYMGQMTINNDYSPTGGQLTDAYVGEVQRHPLHKDLTLQWIEPSGANQGLRRGGVNAMPGGWWMVYSTKLTKTAPAPADISLPKQCNPPFRTIGKKATTNEEQEDSMEVLEVHEDQLAEHGISADELPLNMDFVKHIDRSATPSYEGLSAEDTALAQDWNAKLKEWNVELPTPFKRRPRSLSEEDEIAEAGLASRDEADEQARVGFRPYMSRISSTGTGTKTTYQGTTAGTPQKIEHLQDVTKKVFRINLYSGNSVNESYITQANGFFYSFMDPQTRTMKCEYSSTFNYDDAKRSFSTPPFEWFSNITWNNGISGSAASKGEKSFGFTSTEIPEFIGDFIFQRPTDGVQDYFVDLTPPDKTVEVYLSTTSTTAPTSTQLALPQACIGLPQKGCNRNHEKCLLKALSSTLLSGGVCQYMQATASCFADNFCYKGLNRLCATKRAAQCKIKQCGYPKGGCPPSC